MNPNPNQNLRLNALNNLPGVPAVELGNVVGLFELIEGVAEGGPKIATLLHV